MFVKYRVARDSFSSQKWAVQIWRLWFPFWIEYGIGLLNSKEEAYELIECLRNHK